MENVQINIKCKFEYALRIIHNFETFKRSKLWTKTKACFFKLPIRKFPDRITDRRMKNVKKFQFQTGHLT